MNDITNITTPPRSKRFEGETVFTERLVMMHGKDYTCAFLQRQFGICPLRRHDEKVDISLLSRRIKLFCRFSHKYDTDM
ncbi:MAG: hypothetical protein PHR14_11320 [Oscillospiraceae bacterium]|nr:hypothetical protein [Oscillospiraceae bacterium]